MASPKTLDLGRVRPDPRRFAIEPETPPPAPTATSGDVASARAALERAAARVADARADMNRESETGKSTGWRAARDIYEAEVSREEQAQARLDAALAAERGRSPTAAMQQLLVFLGAPLAGMAAGKMLLAPAIERREAAAIGSRNTELRKLARAADRLMARPSSPAVTARVAGVVATADKMRLGPRPGAWGLPAALLLAGEGLLLRSQVEGAESEAVRSALSAAGLGLTFAAGGQIAARATEIATAKKLTDAGALATIEGARRALATDAVGGPPRRPRTPRSVAPTPPRIMGGAELGALRVRELRAEAKARGITGASRMPKADLVRAISRSMGTPRGAPRPVVRGKLGMALALGAGGLAAGAALMGGDAQAASKAFLDTDARERARAPVAPRPRPVQAASANRAPRHAFERVDGETVMRTRGQIANDLRQRRRRRGGSR